MMVHPTELQEGDRIKTPKNPFGVAVEEVTFLNERSQWETLSCGCCSEPTGFYTIEFRRDDGTEDDFETDQWVEKVTE